MIEIGYSPRNPWAALLKALETSPLNQAARDAALQHVRYHPALGEAALDIFDRQIAAERPEGLNGEKMNTNADLMRNRSGLLRPPFRRVVLGNNPPSPYPFDLTLSTRMGIQNDVQPFYQAIPGMTVDAAETPIRLLVIYVVNEPSAVERILADLAKQKGATTLDIILSTPGTESSFATQAAAFLNPRIVPFGPMSAEMNRLVEDALSTVDGVVFLSGAIEIDSALFDRASRLLRVSDKIVQGLWPVDVSQKMTPYALRTANAFTRRYPFRDMKGLNLLIPSALLRRTGGLDPRFSDSFLAAKELAWRCWNLGAWFSPLLTARVDPENGGETDTDKALYRELSPNSWDRPDDGRFERPKVSIYIPAYNCEKYIENAIGSVLDQDFEDLEVCVAVDGSPDDTLKVLERSFGTDPRVRFADGANGGIGHASNRAIMMSRGIYVGQLDSDDRLKSGAVRRLADYLDEHPDVACCYGSCERIDAEGNFIKQEYSWPEFSREKMMITSIAHHFRMFRRAAWERTETFRTDIINAVDYDVFLKLMDTGRLHHVEETLYQRRWHGENTSSINEVYQTSNTHKVQTEALKRMNLDQFWRVHVANPSEPRKVSYRRDVTKPRILFWPDYSRANPYQHLLYREASETCEITAGPIAAALDLLEHAPKSGPVIFHLHWTNFLFLEQESATAARVGAATFLENLQRFRELGGRVVWTVHNLISHESPYIDEEADLIRRVIEIADVVHFHSAASVKEMTASFPIPDRKIWIAPHGSYEGVYDDHVDHATAREILGLAPDDEVLLHAGQLRPYKGLDDLIAAFRALLPNRPKLRLLIAGEAKYDILGSLEAPLSEVEAARLTLVDRFLDDQELQVFYRAADVAVFPYKSILTSGSMLLSLTFGTPAIIPDVGMTRGVLGDGEGGRVYDPREPDALSKAIVSSLNQGDDVRVAAARKAHAIRWTGMTQIFKELTRR